ncbi:hypothetical protein EC988_008892, partial [Linderina pennispora]
GDSHSGRMPRTAHGHPTYDPAHGLRPKQSFDMANSPHSGSLQTALSSSLPSNNPFLHSSPGSLGSLPHHHHMSGGYSDIAYPPLSAGLDMAGSSSWNTSLASAAAAISHAATLAAGTQPPPAGVTTGNGQPVHPLAAMQAQLTPGYNYSTATGPALQPAHSSHQASLSVSSLSNFSPQAPQWDGSSAPIGQANMQKLPAQTAPLDAAHDAARQFAGDHNMASPPLPTYQSLAMETSYQAADQLLTAQQAYPVSQPGLPPAGPASAGLSAYMQGAHSPYIARG